MRIINVRQGSEEWDELRARPTASEFGSFLTPVKGDYSKKTAKAYAAKIVTKRLGAYVEPPPSYWMVWGTEHEPEAKTDYMANHEVEVSQVGFVIPDHTDSYGGSPDGLVGDDGLLEVKCPAPETLIRYHADGLFPSQYKPQVQGLLMITGRKWCDLFVWHPHIKPFEVRVKADPAYHTKIEDGLKQLLSTISAIENKLSPTIGDLL